jgi:uncharacterized protein
MSLSMHQASVPAFAHTLTALSRILDKAEAHVAAKKIEPAAILTMRLYPDMWTFTRQVQVACDFAKGGAARLAGAEVPTWPDTEASFAELAARIAKTVDFVKSFAPAQIDGSETREITIPVGGQPRIFTGQSYLVDFALPNFYFHVTTAYAILRHAGVELGKRDFLGWSNPG